MKFMKRAAVLAAVTLSTLTIAGCTDTISTPDNSPGNKKVASVGLMVQDLGNPFFASMNNGVKAAAEKLGASYSAQDGRQDLGAQNDQIDAFIQKGLDILLINAVDSEGIGPAIKRARDAGIIVVAVDVGAKNAQATVTTDNVQAGTLACQSLVDQIGTKGEILIVDGTPITSIEDRMTGCNQVLAMNPNVKVVGHQNGDNGREKGLTLATDMLTANPNVVGIFGVNDPTSLGAALAAQQAGKTNLIITGVDGSPEAIAEMKKSGSMFKATAAQDPNLLGAKALEMAVQLFEGKTLPKDLILVPSSIVDSSNLSSYKGWQ